MIKSKLEYIWIDGTKPTQKLRAKTKIVENFKGNVEHVPVWGFDGSSTNQAEGHNSDCVLMPIKIIVDPFRVDSFLVLCEVFDTDKKTPHKTNTRRFLREFYTDDEPYIGFEQEYTFFKNNHPLGWPSGGYPPPQGPFYCGIGADEVYGREIVEKHLEYCLASGIKICGINAEVMPGQWEYQIGYGNPIEMSDDLWLSRYILYRVAEQYGVSATLHPKPIQGDWNGAGLHTNFSTKWTRCHTDDSHTGLDEINEKITSLRLAHEEHIKVYGYGNEQRLTGLHETCDIDTFKSGISDRGASIRIPWQVAEDERGYFEDRRPSANADPYQVSWRLMETICERTEINYE